MILQKPPVDDGPRDLIAAGSRDLELLMNGGFSPLTGFMTEADHDSVCRRMRLRSGAVWPIPVVLDVTEEAAETLRAGSLLALRDPEGVVLAVVHVEQLYRPDREAEARMVYGTASRDHPGVAYLLDRTNPVYVGGRVEGLQLPAHFDFQDLRM